MLFLMEHPIQVQSVTSQNKVVTRINVVCNTLSQDKTVRGLILSNRWEIPEDVETAVMKRDTSCVYCGCQFSSDRSTKRSWEHIVNDINIATLENIALCCVGCNASKGAKPLQVWLKSENAKRRGITEETLSDVVKQALANLHS